MIFHLQNARGCHFVIVSSGQFFVREFELLLQFIPVAFELLDASEIFWPAAIRPGSEELDPSFQSNFFQAQNVFVRLQGGDLSLRGRQSARGLGGLAGGRRRGTEIRKLFLEDLIFGA